MSLYHHMRGYNAFDYHQDWEQFIEHYINGQTLHNSWFDHVRPWWEHRNDDNILFITYESMKADLAGAVRRIAGFIGVTDLTEEEVQSIVHQSSFESMKGDSKTNMMWNASKRKEAEQPFMRKGIVGMCVCGLG